MKWKYVVTWLPGIVIGILNGMLREGLYRQVLNELPAHQLSGVSFVLLFGVYVWFILPWLSLSSGAEAIRCGLTWLALTVVFEFLFGHFVMGHPWERLFHDYNILEGRTWVIVLVWIAAAPAVLYGFRKRVP